MISQNLCLMKRWLECTAKKTRKTCIELYHSVIKDIMPLFGQIYDFVFIRFMKMSDMLWFIFSLKVNICICTPFYKFNFIFFIEVYPHFYELQISQRQNPFLLLSFLLQWNKIKTPLTQCKGILITLSFAK